MQKGTPHLVYTRWSGLRAGLADSIVFSYRSRLGFFHCRAFFFFNFFSFHLTYMYMSVL